ncbi:MAG TPA: hypothetical protein VGE38_06185 [Nocardioides sp.]|uniref:hypothetical protein n=1 Tax=Nocardioides sp. TaxID=35761 RepID=UPI002EDA3EF1
MLKLLLVVMLIAAVTYLTLRVIQRRGVVQPGRPQFRVPPPGRTARRPRPTRGPLGPDDDEEFLRDLDRKRLFPDDPEG